MEMRSKDKGLGDKPLKRYKADLHVHTVLSPCGDLEMSPGNIIEKAIKENIQIIGITDHNSTKNAGLVKQLAEKEGILVLTGAEVTTKEEVHCLAFFENDHQLNLFQEFLDKHIMRIANPNGHFGYQPVVDENDNILEMIPYVLSAALSKGINQVQEEIKRLEGLFVPAHVNRSANGIFSQLGFIPDTLEFDALGISGRIKEQDLRGKYNLDDKITLVRNSDAHFLSQLGEQYSWFEMKDLSFDEIRKTLRQTGGRRILTEGQ